MLIRLRAALLVLVLAAGAPGATATSDSAASEAAADQLFAEAASAAQAGDQRRAADLLREALHDADRGVIHYNLACALARLGEREEAFAELARSIDTGFTDAPQIAQDDDLVTLHADARFQPLVARAAAAEQAFDAAHPPMADVVVLPHAPVNDERFPVVVALHGVGDNPRHFADRLKGWTTSSGRALIAICGSRHLDQIGTAYGWRSPEDWDRIRDLVVAHLKDPHLDATHVYLLGFSQGGFMVYPVGLRNPDLFRGIISSSGGIEPRAVSEAMLANAAPKLPVVIIHGTKDQIVPFAYATSAEAILTGAHVRFELQTFDGAHQLPPDFPAVYSAAIASIERMRSP